MRENEPANIEQEHAEVLPLLSRYADLERAGRDAARMYPMVSRHLRACVRCRALLADILQAPEAAHAGDPLPGAARFDFDQVEPAVFVTPGSSAAAFRVQVVLRLPDSATLGGSGGAYRSGDARPGGERLLFADVIALDDCEIGVMLTVEGRCATCPEDLGECVVAGELYGDDLPAAIQAQLDVGRYSYRAPVRDGRLRFERVNLHAPGQSVSLTLETPE